MPVNLTLVSPSGVGAYAACPQKLVFDSTHGKPFEKSEYADFGTLCHYMTQYKMGLNPGKEPDEKLFASAMRLPEFIGQKLDVLMDAVSACADLAISTLNDKHPLPAGIHWIAEHEVSDPTLLPTRMNRRNEVKGYSGDMDLLRSDRVCFIDLKFVSKIPSKCKVEYLWQMGSYHFLSGVPKTILLFVTRDAKYSATIQIDWSLTSMANLAQQMRRTVAKMGHSDFEKFVAPFEGDQCGFCEHHRRCPLKNMPTVTNHMKTVKKAKPVDQSFLTNLAASVALQKQQRLL